MKFRVGILVLSYDQLPSHFLLIVILYGATHPQMEDEVERIPD